jgi:hypothetical protein
MRFETYVMLLFSLSVVFFFLGYQSPLMQVLNNQGCTTAQIAAAEAAGTSLNCTITPSSFLSILASNMTSDNAIAALLGIAVIGAAVLLSGFGAIYIIPLMMLLAFLNYVVFPISFIFDPALPALIKYPLVVFFNLLMILSVVSFTRGSV